MPDQSKPTNELLTVAGASRILDVSPRTVRRYLSGGRLPAVKVGPAVRNTQDAVDELHRQMQAAPVRRAKGRRFGLDDPLWSIVGAFDAGPSDVSTNKLTYFAEAYETSSHW